MVTSAVLRDAGVAIMSVMLMTLTGSRDRPH